MAIGEKYIKLTKYLKNSNKDIVRHTFSEISNILGFSIPNSAYKHTASWSNRGRHPFSHGWLNAGYLVIEYDIKKEYAIFKKSDETFKLVEKFKLEAGRKSEKQIDESDRSVSSSLPLFKIDVNDDSYLNITKVLDHLKKKRFAFHSEADFQFQLAWAIKEVYLDRVEVILEYPTLLNGNKAFIDIVVLLDGNKHIPIELKYKTKVDLVEIGNFYIELNDHAAQDLGRFDYLLDIERLEQYREQWDFSEGYTILLTNDPSYQKRQRADANSIEFSLEHGAVKTGIMKWKETSSIYKKKHRKESILLKDEYPINWNIYANHNIEEQGYTIYFYILINKILKK